MERIVYISLEKAIFVHTRILEKESGLKGVKDLGQVESILTHIQNNEYYPNFLDKIYKFLNIPRLQIRAISIAGRYM